MLIIRDEQMQSFAPMVERRFESEMRDLFVRYYPREARQAGGPEAMLHWVRAGIDSCREAGFASQYQIGRWLALMMMLGAGFAGDPQLPWVGRWLDSREEPDPTARIDNLFSNGIRYLRATAGENAEYVVRAMIRIRGIDFAHLPALPEAAAVLDNCARLRDSYPQKFAYQGQDLTAACTARQRQRAREVGMESPGGQFLFVVLAFMLGEGFDADPLHPWAREILHGTPERGGRDTAARLEKAARDHLALSLAGA